MDYLKTRAPFWKKEHRADGSEGDWVAAKEKDDDAARKMEALVKRLLVAHEHLACVSAGRPQLIWS